MKSAPAATVFIIDDNEGVRQSIEDLLNSVGLAAQSYATAEEFLRSKHPDGPSCLVLDVRLPGISGLDFQHELAAAGRMLPIIFISAHGDIPMTVKAMKSGAVEFLTKPFRDQDLLDAVQQALQRDRTSREERRDFDVLQKRYATLTPRERQVMSLVISGMLNKQIAAELGASETTVKIHRGRVMEKMEAGSVAELVRMTDKLKFAQGK
ncbi:MAG TPA: response regulator transcription factor [Bryobacteraceae bacterium]|jgi:FixJ family two-component response regulator|nr:response regulator transcription factor [Bryobacteraceae bacterium]